MVVDSVQPNKAQWPNSGPIQIYINTKRISKVADFHSYLDDLIKSLPGWSETEYELRWANNLEAIEANLGKLKNRPPRCVAIIIDEENQEKESLPYLLKNLHNLSHGFSAAILHDTDNDDLNMYRKNNSSLYVATRTVNKKSKIYTKTNAIHASNIQGVKKNDQELLVPNLHWPLIKSNTLDTLLDNLARYFIFLGQDLGIIKPKPAKSSKPKNNLLAPSEKKDLKKILKLHWDSIMSDVKLFQVTDPEGDLCLAYNFAKNHCNFNPWTQLRLINLTEFLNEYFLQELCGKNKITEVNDLKKVFEYLGFKTINLSDEV